MAILARDQAKESRSSVLRTRAPKTPAWRVLAVVVVLVLTATGTRAPAIAQTAVKFSLDFKIEGPAAPFLIGIDKGYYKAGGLDVTIDPSPGSLETIHRLASGAYDIGIADINLLIRYRTEHPGTPLRAVFMVYNRPPFAIVARKSRGISKPQDLEGKRLGAPIADTSFAQWPVFTQAAGIDARKVTIENVGLPVREPMLAAGQIDAVTAYSFNSYVDLKDRGVPTDDLVVMLMANYGLDLYGDAIIVNPQFAAAHPEAVTAFLRAVVQGLKDSARDPATAVDSVLRRADGEKKDVELERLRMALNDNILVPEVRANGYGGVDVARLEKSIDQVAAAHEVKSKPLAVDIFDPSFLPGTAERKTN
jgi:NitT/TauT family transport system substrate-binding protein